MTFCQHTQDICERRKNKVLESLYLIHIPKDLSGLINTYIAQEAIQEDCTFSVQLVCHYGVNDRIQSCILYVCQEDTIESVLHRFAKNEQIQMIFLDGLCIQDHRLMYRKLRRAWKVKECLDSFPVHFFNGCGVLIRFLPIN